MIQHIDKAPLRQYREDSWELRKLVSIFRRRLPVIIAVGAVVSSAIVYRAWLQTPIYKQEFQLFLDTTPDNEIDPLSENARKSSFVPLQFRDFKTDIEVLSSYKVISPLLPEIQSRYPDLNYSKLVKKLKIKQKENTAIVEISYKDSDPEKIRFILDKLAKGYTAYSLEKLQISSNQALKLVDTQLPRLKKRVDELQAQLQTFRRSYNLVDPEQQSEILAERLGNLIQQIQETQSQVGEAQSSFNNLQQQLGIDIKQAIAISALSEAPRYLALLDKVQELDTNIASQSVKLTGGHPVILKMREQKQRLLPLVEQEVVAVLGTQSVRELNGMPAIASPNTIRLELVQRLIETSSQLKGLKSKQQSLVISENEARQKLQEFAATARQYADLSRNLEIANQSLNRFLAARENLQIETARKVSPWQVISAIEAPTKPISPNIPRELLLGSIAGLLAGVGIVILAEKLDNKYRSPEELPNDTRIPFLGTIPFHKQLKTAPTQLSRNGTLANSSYWEAYISLQANLDFLEPDKPLKSLVISSALPGEGKSTISLYLAKVAAAMGKRVLLIDADLRRPTIHRYVDLTNAWGLSNLISGVTEPDQLIQSLPKEENLYILTAGQSPPNPVRLLSSAKMKDLLAQFQTNFDLVIFDTPPIHGFADAKFLATQTDGLILVVGLDKTEKPAVKQVLNDLQLSHVNVLGIVANGVKGYTPSYSGYYEHYYGKNKGSYRLVAGGRRRDQGNG